MNIRDIRDIDELLSVLLEIEEDSRYNKIKYFEPDTWQKGAIALGKHEKVRGIICGNRLGKTYSASYELCVHLTGLYPDDWEGHKFNKAINALAMGESWTQLMGSGALHDLIMGTLLDLGSGWIPRDCIIKTMSSGQNGAFSTVRVKHISGSVSTLRFGTYQSGDKVLMGSSLDFVLIDECPSDKTILPQCIKRTWTTKGLVLCSFTPEKGLNETVKAFWDKEGIYHSGLIHATLYDSGLYTSEEKRTMVESIPPWQQEFSIYGRPSAGAGAVFAGIVKSCITSPIPEIQPHWKRLCAIDFGFRDPNVVLFGTKDPETGIYYVYDELMHTDTDIKDIAPLVQRKQKGYIPLIWPLDGKAERGLGKTLIEQYKDYHVITTDDYTANWNMDPEGKNRSIAPGIMFIRQLMKDNLLYISPTCVTVLREFDTYSYDENGKFVDKDNHAIDCLRYLLTAIDKFGKTKLENASTGQAYIPSEGW